MLSSNIFMKREKIFMMGNLSFIGCLKLSEFIVALVIINACSWHYYTSIGRGGGDGLGVLTHNYSFIYWLPGGINFSFSPPYAVWFCFEVFVFPCTQSTPSCAPARVYFLSFGVRKLSSLRLPHYLPYGNTFVSLRVSS